MKSRLLIIVVVSVIVVLGTIDTVHAYPIHDLTYSNSPHLNKQTPSLEKTTEFLYQAYGENTKNDSFDLTVSITNLDEQKKVYFKKHQLSANGFEMPHDIFWNFVPEKSGLYVVEVLDKSKIHKRFFAVPEDNSLKRIPVTNPELLENTSPRKQFRMGIDPKLVICDNDLFLALKKDNQPVCLTLDTLVELRERNYLVAENIDYNRIGLLYSENEFKSILEEKNIEYTENNYIMMTGMSLTSLPPSTGYCGYVLDDKDEDYWFSSGYSFPTFTSGGLSDANPHPCGSVMDFTCECSIQRQLLEKDLTELSFFDEFQEKYVGQVFRDFLNEGGKIANVPNSFIIGKYNMNLDSDVTLFCGQFQGKMYWHFIGTINGTKITDWGLGFDERPKLCAIHDNPSLFTFDESAIVKP